MQHSHEFDLPDHARELAQLTDLATGQGREIVEIGAFLHDLDAECRAQTSALGHIRSSTSGLASSSTNVTEAATRMVSAALDAITGVEQSASFIAASGQNAQTIAQWVRQVNADGSEVEDLLRAVQLTNTQISDIAGQVTILAVNAKIEAARAGQFGKGFSIVADEVNDLSQKTAAAADQISTTINRLSAWVANLQGNAEQNARDAEDVLARSTETDKALSDIEHRVRMLHDDALGLRVQAETSSDAVAGLGPAVEQMASSILLVAKGVDETSRRCNTLVDTSENILQHSVALGGNGEDGPMITRAQDIAGQMSQLFETAVERGEISLQQLFDSTYRPIAGSDPQQVTTAFTALTDRLLPPLQEAALQIDPRVVFCAAVDRNGYLPTHNRKFSHPPSEDPVWNAANCRNRRIFDDRVGLKAGRNERPFLLQVYRRDMGGGNFVMMKDLSAPIRVQGRHWGGVRLAYKF